MSALSRPKVKMNQEYLLHKMIDHIGYLLNSTEPHAEINKLISIEFTLNPQAKDLSFEEVFGQVVEKLIKFYEDDELRELWQAYILVDHSELTDEYFDDYLDDDAA